MVEVHYPKTFTDGLEAIWGEGFLSPGGPAEVAKMLEGSDLNNHWVLDIGCGLGGVDVLLVEEHGADRVVGIDIEPQLVSAATTLINRRGLIDQIAIELVQPGPLPFEDEYFDTVFSKDALLHIADKPALYAEILRVLKPGGRFVGSDWLSDQVYSDTVPESLAKWSAVTGLENVVWTPADHAAETMRAAGFTAVETNDRNEWYIGELAKEEALVTHDYAGLVAEVGEEVARTRRASLAARAPAVRDGYLRPTHIRAQKPA